MFGKVRGLSDVLDVVLTLALTYIGQAAWSRRASISPAGKKEMTFLSNFKLCEKGGCFFHIRSQQHLLQRCSHLSSPLGSKIKQFKILYLLAYHIPYPSKSALLNRGMHLWWGSWFSPLELKHARAATGCASLPAQEEGQSAPLRFTILILLQTLRYCHCEEIARDWATLRSSLSPSCLGQAFSQVGHFYTCQHRSTGHFEKRPAL